MIDTKALIPVDWLTLSAGPTLLPPLEAWQETAPLRFSVRWNAMDRSVVPIGRGLPPTTMTNVDDLPLESVVCTTALGEAAARVARAATRAVVNCILARLFWRDA